MRIAWNAGTWKIYILKHYLVNEKKYPKIGKVHKEMHTLGQTDLFQCKRVNQNGVNQYQTKEENTGGIRRNKDWETSTSLALPVFSKTNKLIRLGIMSYWHHIGKIFKSETHHPIKPFYWKAQRPSQFFLKRTLHIAKLYFLSKVSKSVAKSATLKTPLHPKILWGEIICHSKCKSQLFTIWHVTTVFFK